MSRRMGSKRPFPFSLSVLIRVTDLPVPLPSALYHLYVFCETLLDLRFSVSPESCDGFATGKVRLYVTFWYFIKCKNKKKEEEER